MWLCEIQREIKNWIWKLLYLSSLFLLSWEFSDSSGYLFVALGFSHSALSSPVEKVKNQWDSTQHSVELRQQQLKHMLADSLWWDEQRQEMERLMEQCEIRLRMLLQAPREALAKQISDTKVRPPMLFFFPLPDSLVYAMLVDSIDVWIYSLVIGLMWQFCLFWGMMYSKFSLFCISDFLRLTFLEGNRWHVCLFISVVEISTLHQINDIIQKAWTSDQ